MIYLKKTINYIWDLINPISTLKWFIAKLKKHKKLLIFSVVASILLPAFSCFCVNFSPLAKFITNNGLIMDATMNQLTVHIDGDLGTYVKSVYDVLVPVGQALAMLIWIIGLGEIAMRDDLTPEMILKDFFKIIVTLIVIGNYGFDIIKGIIDLFDNIFELIIGEISSSPQAPLNIVADNYSSVPLGKMGTALLTLGIMAGLKIVVNISIAVTIWQRKVKILLMAAVTPIGLYDFRDGFHSNAANFIRKFASLCIQGLMILITNLFCIILINDQFGASFQMGKNIYDSFMNLIMLAPLFIVLITFLKSTEQIANDVLGAH